MRELMNIVYDSCGELGALRTATGEWLISYD